MSSAPQNQASQDDPLKESLRVEEAKRNPEKFEALYNTYYERIFRFAYQRVDEKEIASDITQQVFMKAMLNIRKYEYRGLPFSSWLYRIARNELNQLFRKNNSHRTVNIDETDLRYVADEMKVDGLEEYSKILPDVIAELDEDDLQLVEMRFFEKRAFKEIADILDITENNAKVKLYRVLDKMKAAILKK
jgi:RNA polymerase sigma-70 factor (ECF subfamily)